LVYFFVDLVRVFDLDLVIFFFFFGAAFAGAFDVAFGLIAPATAPVLVASMAPSTCCSFASA